MAEYETFQSEWEGIALLIRWAPNWLTGTVAHLEIESRDRVPLPITQTGYRSHFTTAETVDGQGGPVAFAKTFLDLEAMSPEWQEHQLAARQLSLF